MILALGKAPIRCAKALRAQKDILTNWMLYKHLVGPVRGAQALLMADWLENVDSNLQRRGFILDY